MFDQHLTISFKVFLEVKTSLTEQVTLGLIATLFYLTLHTCKLIYNFVLVKQSSQEI